MKRAINWIVMAIVIAGIAILAGVVFAGADPQPKCGDRCSATYDEYVSGLDDDSLP